MRTLQSSYSIRTALQRRRTLQRRSRCRLAIWQPNFESIFIFVVGSRLVPAQRAQLPARGADPQFQSNMYINVEQQQTPAADRAAGSPLELSVPPLGPILSYVW